MPNPWFAPFRGQIEGDEPAQAGLNVTFVDTTYFHNRGGEIHCATNAIRKREVAK